MTSPNVIQDFRGKHAFLSNFYTAPIKWDVKTGPALNFPTNEHAFQGLKYKAMVEDEVWAYLSSITDAKTPGEAKKLGREVKIDVAKWDSIKVDVMRRIVWEKFRQHSNLRKELLDTGHALLVEGNTWGDTFWGRCNGKGYNILGSILMEVRGFWLWSRTEVDILTPDSCQSPCLCSG